MKQQHRVTSNFRRLIDSIEEGLRFRYVWRVAADYGELVTMTVLHPSLAHGMKPTIRSDVYELLTRERDALLRYFGANQQGIRQIVRSGYGLIFEELVQILSKLSSHDFAKRAIHDLNLPPLPSSDPLDMEEIAEYLLDCRRAYPSSWRASLFIPPEHWWWDRESLERPR